MSESTSSASGAPETSTSGDWTLLTPDVMISSVEDMKDVKFQNNKTGEIFTAYEYMMNQMGIAAAEDAQKQEEHRKKTMKDLQQT